MNKEPISMLIVPEDGSNPFNVELGVPGFSIGDPMFRAILFDANDSPLTVSPLFASEDEAEDWAFQAIDNLSTVTYEILEIVS